jgi:hypothetical protein
MKALALIFGLTLAGCASQTYLRNIDLMQKGTAAVITETTGLVFGERCGGGGFNFEAVSAPGSTIVPGWTSGQRYFFMSLPAGEYLLAAIGSPNGGYLGEPPLRFNVTAGKATYIGAVQGTWSYQLCAYSPSSAVVTRSHMRPVMVNQDRNRSPVFVYSNPEGAAKALEHEYSQVKLSGYLVGLLR